MRSGENSIYSTAIRTETRLTWAYYLLVSVGEYSISDDLSQNLTRHREEGDSAIVFGKPIIVSLKQDGYYAISPCLRGLTSPPHGSVHPKEPGFYELTACEEEFSSDTVLSWSLSPPHLAKRLADLRERGRLREKLRLLHRSSEIQGRRWRGVFGGKVL